MRRVLALWGLAQLFSCLSEGPPVNLRPVNEGDAGSRISGAACGGVSSGGGSCWAIVYFQKIVPTFKVKSRKSEFYGVAAVGTERDGVVFVDAVRRAATARIEEIAAASADGLAARKTAVELIRLRLNIRF